MSLYHVGAGEEEAKPVKNGKPNTDPKKKDERSFGSYALWGLGIIGVICGARWLFKSKDNLGHNPGNPGKRWESSAIQSLVFDRDLFTLGDARTWAKRHGFRDDKVDVTQSAIRLRQVSPVQFSDFKMKELTPGISAVLGGK